MCAAGFPPFLYTDAKEAAAQGFCPAMSQVVHAKKHRQRDVKAVSCATAIRYCEMVRCLCLQHAARTTRWCYMYLTVIMCCVVPVCCQQLIESGNQHDERLTKLRDEFLQRAERKAQRALAR